MDAETIANTNASHLEIPCHRCQVRNRAICAALQDDQLVDLNAISEHVHLDREQTVFFEGDNADHLYNIIQGHVRVYKSLADGRRQITGFLYPSNFLGLSVAGTYPYSAETISAVTLCRFPRKGMSKIIEKYPSFEHNLLELASNELAAAQEHVLLLGRKTAAERLCSFILNISAKQNTSEQNETVMLPMTRQDIADYLGLTIETVSRTFTRLKKSGVIELMESDIIGITSQEQLETLALGDQTV